MADFREMTVDRGKNTAIVKFRERQKGLTVAGKIVMSAPVFNKYLSQSAFHKYHVSNFHAVYPSRHGDAREYCGGYKGYKIIIWQKKNPPGSPFYVTIKKGKREYRASRKSSKRIPKEKKSSEENGSFDFSGLAK